jgi:hypothetical protein
MVVFRKVNIFGKVFGKVFGKLFLCKIEKLEKFDKKTKFMICKKYFNISKTTTMVIGILGIVLAFKK